MRLVKVRLRNFRRFRGEHALDLNENVLALVGANEAGKSTALRAITGFFYGIPEKTSDAHLYDNARLRIGGRLRYTTGNPMTPAAGAYQDEDGDWVAVDGPVLSQRLPDFFQLDLRVDRTWRRPWGAMNLYIDLQNVVNRKNAEGVTYNEDYTRRSYTTGLPIFPSIGVEYVP